MAKTETLDKYSQRFKKMVTADKKVDPFEKYESCLGNKDVIAVKFTLADPDGNLYYTDKNGIQCMIRESDLSYALDYYEPFMKSQFVNREFFVTIKEIDRENNRVYYRSARSNHYATSEKVISEISGALKEDKHPEIYGKINRVTENMVYVDIYEKGVLGMCAVREWRKGYTQRLTDEAKVGMILPFIVREEARPPKKAGIRKAFMLSRVELTRDPWEELSPEIEEGSVILVECLERPPKVTWWWGRTDSAPGIPVWGEYNSNFQVRQGLSYKCKVTKLDRDNKQFQAVPFDVTDFKSEEAEENFRILTRGKGVRQQESSPDAVSADKAKADDTKGGNAKANKSKGRNKAADKPADAADAPKKDADGEMSAPAGDGGAKEAKGEAKGAKEGRKKKRASKKGK